MIELKIDGPFPLKNPNGLNDGIFANINGESFDVVCWAGGLNPKERKIWRRGSLRYGVYIKDHIPFFLVDFPEINWSMDVSINIWAEVARRRDVDSFLFGMGNAVNLYLIDTKTNTIKGMRLIGIMQNAARLIKDACKKQLVDYPSAISVDAVLEKFLRESTTEGMMRNCEMISLPRKG